MRSKQLPVIKVVGISGSGKSTLVKCLRFRGFDARPVSQEHSDVPDLWQRFDHPFALIYLSVSLAEQTNRRPTQTWTYTDLAREQMRLANAREAADLRVDTSNLNPEQVCEVVVAYLNRIGIEHGPGPLPPVRPTGSARQPEEE